MKVRNKLFAGALVVGLLACVYWVLHESGTLTMILESNARHALVMQLGAWGPAAIVGLMILAILSSQIPSAPIALAAGAAYGHGWGILYVLLSAEAGSVAAFAISREVGFGTLHSLVWQPPVRWLGLGPERTDEDRLGQPGPAVCFV